MLYIIRLIFLAKINFEQNKKLGVKRANYNGAVNNYIRVYGIS